MWAPVEDWEVVKRSPDNLEKVLQVMSSHLLDKTVSTAAGTVAWIFLTALKAKMDCALHDAVQGPNGQSDHSKYSFDHFTS